MRARKHMSTRGKLFVSLAIMVGVALLGGGAEFAFGWELDMWSILYGGGVGISASIMADMWRGE